MHDKVFQVHRMILNVRSLCTAARAVPRYHPVSICSGWVRAVHRLQRVAGGLNVFRECEGVSVANTAESLILLAVLRRPACPPFGYNSPVP